VTAKLLHFSLCEICSLSLIFGFWVKSFLTRNELVDAYSV